jgi:putative ABC transport system substrate-binding protein
MAHPGGNVTGLSSTNAALSGKRLELLRTAIPDIARVGVLRNPDNLARQSDWDNLRQAAQAFEIDLVALEFHEPDDFDRGFASAAAQRVDAVVVVGEPMVSVERGRIVDLAEAYGIPLMFERGELLEVGGLMSYGVPLTEIYRRSASYVDRVLRGANPADLPIETPVQYELAINLRSAQELGIALSPSLLLQANRLIQ